MPQGGCRSDATRTASSSPTSSRSTGSCASGPPPTTPPTPTPTSTSQSSTPAPAAPASPPSWGMTPSCSATCSAASRQQIIHDGQIFRYIDGDLAADLTLSEDPSRTRAATRSRILNLGASRSSGSSPSMTSQSSISEYSLVTDTGSSERRCAVFGVPCVIEDQHSEQPFVQYLTRMQDLPYNLSK